MEERKKLPIEESSIELLAKTSETEKLMESYYCNMLNKSPDEEMEKDVKEYSESLKRAMKNTAKAHLMTFDMLDELNGRWNDIKGARKRKRGKAPAINAEVDLEESSSSHFAKGLGFYKLFWIFLIGSFIGVVVELLWCYIRHGYFESRSALVYGPFNPLYGCGAVMLSVILYKYRNRTDLIPFIGGFLGGSVLEYACSFFQEMILGSTSWDYSAVPLNINGRICVLYSVFWGFLGIFWIKKCFPHLSRLLLRIPNRIGKTLTWLLIAFMILDASVTCTALYRWVARMDGKEAGNAITAMIDEHFSDERMESIYPNMVFARNG